MESRDVKNYWRNSGGNQEKTDRIIDIIDIMNIKDIMEIMEKRREKERKRREKMSRVNYYQSAFNSQKEQLYL